MEQIKKRVEQIKNQGFDFNNEAILNQLFSNYKKIAFYSGSLILVFIFLLILFVFIGLVNYFGLENLLKMIKPESLKPENFSKEFILIYTIASILLSSLFSPFFAGFLKMAYCADVDQEFKTSSMFDYYDSKYFLNLFLSSLIISVTNFFISSFFEYSGMVFLGLLTTLLVSFLSILTVPLIIFGNLKAFEAIKSSVIVISKIPLKTMSIVSLVVLFVLLGLLVFYIGVIFTFPIIYSMYYVLYKEIFGLTNENEDFVLNQ